MTRTRVVTGAAVIVIASSVAAWSLAYPQSSLAGGLIRAVSDCAAAVTLGLAVVPMLDIQRYRGELVRHATTPLAIASAVWLLAELIRLVLVAAQTAAVALIRVGIQTSADVALHTGAGRSGLVSIAAAAVVCLVSIAAPRTPPLTVTTAGVAAAGFAARTLVGHLADNAVAGMAVSVHALAAALWCGVLAALVIAVEHRGQWARVLPRFSQLSLLCVVALLVGGVVSAVTALDSPAQLYTSGYGRVLTAKIAITGGLIVLAWRNRTEWLPAARSHRTTAEQSRSRSLVELAIMTVALTLAAALAVAG